MSAGSQPENSGEQGRGFSLGGRLKTQLTAFFVAVSLAMMGTTGVVTYRAVEKVLQKQSATITNQFLAQSEYNIMAQLGMVDKATKLIMVSTELSEYLDRGWRGDYISMETANRVFARCSQTMGTYPSIHSVYFYTEDAHVLGVTPRSRIVTAENYRPGDIVPPGVLELMESDMRKALWLGAYTSLDFAGNHPQSTPLTPVVPYVTTIRRFLTNGSRGAYVVVNIDQQVLSDTFSVTEPGQTRENYLIDKSGVIISHGDPAMLGRRMPHDPRKLAAGGDNFFMDGNTQVNYHYIEALGWHLISEVPRDVLYRDISSIQRLFLGAGLAVLVVGLLLSNYWIFRITRPLDTLRGAMQRMEQGGVGEQLEADSRGELGQLGQQFNEMSLSIQRLIAQVKHVEGEKRAVEMEALRNQINPHFLFNTLSNLKYMSIIKGSPELGDCITALGNLLQPLYNSEGDFWPIRTETEYLANYVRVMNYRFGGAVSVRYEMEEALRETPILKFILQPLVENAIMHGTGGQEGELYIAIRFALRGADLYAAVADNGGGIAPEKLREIRRMLARPGSARASGASVGLVNVHRRVQTYYGNEYGVRIDEGPGQGLGDTQRLGVEVGILFPFRPDGKGPALE